MPNTIYTNWLSKTRECGISNEQACGLAMIYAWTLTSEDKPDKEDFWAFISQNEFNEIKQSAFLVDDFMGFYPEFKMAGEILRVKMPAERKDSEGNSTQLLNMAWQEGPVEGPSIEEVMLLRHRFDMMWCQRVGECLREEIRTPKHAYVFADYVTDGFSKFDPEGFARILSALLYKKSPLALMFSSKHFLKESHGLKSIEPFQIALRGITAGLDYRLDEQLWNLQRTLFYKQPGGEPIHLDKQYNELTSFIEFAAPIIENFIDAHKASYLDFSRYVASEYILKTGDKSQLHEQLFTLLDERYGITCDFESNNISQNLLMNAASFYTLCCLCIRNLTNQNTQEPKLRMLDGKGLLWAREVEQPQSLTNEAVQCFDTMLSWRFGSACGLFLKMADGFIQRIYIGDMSKYEDIVELFSMICTAYRPVQCVIAYVAKDSYLNGDVSEEIDIAIFLTINLDGSTGADIYSCKESLERGVFLDEYLGHSDNDKFCKGSFDKVRDSLLDQLDPTKAAKMQIELIDEFATAEAWQFLSE
jgi:hypothetical protein